jgi:hypothetical protein
MPDAITWMPIETLVISAPPTTRIEAQHQRHAQYSSVCHAVC